MPENITLCNVRLSYCNLFQAKAPYDNPNGEKKYSSALLLPKLNTEAKAMLDAAHARAFENAVATKWGGVRPQIYTDCIHDGDGLKPRAGTAYGDECKGCWVINASAREAYPPLVVDQQRQTIVDPRQIYSGVWANVVIHFWAYNNAGNRGIGCSLDAVQKVRDDTPLGGQTIRAEDVFEVLPMDTANPGAAGSSWF